MELEKQQWTLFMLLKNIHVRIEIPFSSSFPSFISSLCPFYLLLPSPPSLLTPILLSSIFKFVISPTVSQIPNTLEDYYSYAEFSGTVFDLRTPSHFFLLPSPSFHSLSLPSYLHCSPFSLSIPFLSFPWYSLLLFPPPPPHSSPYLPHITCMLIPFCIKTDLQDFVG